MSRRCRGLIYLIAAALVAVIMSACGSSSGTSSTRASTSSGSAGASASAKAKPPITVVAISDLTGPTKSIGLPHAAGVKGAAAYLNAQGGIDGHHVNVQILNDNGDPSIDVSALVKRLSSGALPTLVVSGNEGNQAAAVIPVLKRYNVLSLLNQDPSYVCVKHADVDCPNEFSLTVSVASEQVPVANWLKAKKIKKVGILEQELDYTEEETPAVVKAAGSLGIAHTIATFPTSAVDLTPEMDELKSAGVQAVYVLALGPSVGYAYKARAALGWKAPILCDPACAATGPAGLVSAADYKNSWEDIPFTENGGTPNAARSAMIRYAAPYYGGVTTSPLISGATGWDPLIDLDDAVTAAGGSLDPKALSAALLKIPPTDPRRLFSRELGYTATNHDNTLSQPNDYEMVPVAPMTSGQVG
jgi:branched-chain amino acid transport system substrate-binding protein